MSPTNLEEKQTQSLSYTSPKGKETTRGSRAGVTPAIMQSITPTSAKVQSASYTSITVQSTTPTPVMAQNATPAPVTVPSTNPTSFMVPGATLASVMVQGATPTSVVMQSEQDLRPPPTLWEDEQGDMIDYDAEVAWDDNEDDDDPADYKGIKLFKVTEKTEKFLTIAFTSASPNTTRRQWRDKFGAPHTNATACPNLDKIIKARLSPTAKSRDRQLAKQQALSLDSVGPISFILEEAARGQLNQKSAIEAA